MGRPLPPSRLLPRAMEYLVSFTSPCSTCVWCASGVRIDSKPRHVQQQKTKPFTLENMISIVLLLAFFCRGARRWTNAPRIGLSKNKKNILPGIHKQTKKANRSEAAHTVTTDRYYRQYCCRSKGHPPRYGTFESEQRGTKPSVPPHYTRQRTIGHWRLFID